MIRYLFYLFYSLKVLFIKKNKMSKILLLDLDFTLFNNYKLLDDGIKDFYSMEIVVDQKILNFVREKENEGHRIFIFTARGYFNRQKTIRQLNKNKVDYPVIFNGSTRIKLITLNYFIYRKFKVTLVDDLCDFSIEKNKIIKSWEITGKLKKNINYIHPKEICAS